MDGTTMDGNQLECHCGKSMRVEGETDENGGDLTATCSDCGRGYVVTVTRFRGPSEGGG